MLNKERLWKTMSMGSCISNEKGYQNMIKLYIKRHDVSMMVWAFFQEEKPSDLVKVSEDFVLKKMRYSVNSYIEVLEHNHKRIQESNLTIMQDNATIKIAEKMKK